MQDSSATMIETPLTDPAYRVERNRTPSASEEIERKHREHMKRVDQEDWLQDLFDRVNELTVIEKPKKKGAKRGSAKQN